MENSDLHDHVPAIWNNFRAYPLNQLKGNDVYQAIEGERLQKQLASKENTIFDGAEAKIHIWETGKNNKFPNPRSEDVVSDLHALQRHLIQGRQDPQIRHFFFQSSNSRSPLDCSVDMFKFTSTYHQIDPSFLESVFSFGEQDEPTDLCLAQFRAKIPLGKDEPILSTLSSLGRSGREIKLSYLLRAVERSKGTEIWDWNIRQVATYHSFDVETGRSVWATIKANDVLRKRIKDFSPLLDIPSDDVCNDLGISSCLKASVATHLVLLSWCDEGWRDFINDFEVAVRKIVRPASNALVDDHLTPDTSNFALGAWPQVLRPSRKLTIQSNHQYKSSSSTGVAEHADLKHPQTWFQGLYHHLFPKTTKEVVPDEEKGLHLNNLEANGPRPRSEIDPMGALNKFRFKDVQSLYKQSALLERSLLVLDLNLGVMRDIRNYYDNLAQLHLGSHACRIVVGGFLVELDSIMRRLETRRTQLSSLSNCLGQSIQLYEMVLQQRSNQIGITFAEAAHKSADQMQIIADKTSKETASMHVITVVTLIFLPATFVATFFQSGVFIWNDDTPKDMTESYRYQADGFQLFAAVCGPLTMITIGTWLFMRRPKQPRY